MKRNFFVNMLGGFVGFFLALLLANFTNSANALSVTRPVAVQSSPSNVSAPAAVPVSTTFTYQGRLNSDGTPVTGTCNLAFRLYDDPSAGNLIGSPITTTVPINSGLFTAGLNFGGGAFTGEARWLDIRVRCPAGSGSYTTLAPRQALTPAPYALAFGAPGGVYGYLTAPYPTLGFNTYGPSYLAGVSGYGGILQFNDGDGSLNYDTGSNVAAGQPHVNSARVTIDKDGDVGIGTSDPQRNLHVSGANSVLRLESSDSHVWTVTEYKTDSRLWHTGVGGSAVSNDVKGKYYIFDGTAGQFRMVIGTDGNVGIGTMPDGNATLTIQAGQFGGLLVKQPNGNAAFHVSEDGSVFLANLTIAASTTHICTFGGYIGTCSSAAEYVPTIDGGKGFPETADLVSIAPTVKNPYGDSHGPFTVQKSSTACDPNLLGFIVKPESGADGEKLNDHYLPLAIYGYFPAKVTMENGAIHRGDALTSSSKPGYAMKATQACKIIGYALEDADHEGTIQVFANHGESAAPEVVALRTQVKELKDQNAALDARLNALEQTMSGQTQAPSTPSGNVVLLGALLVVGIVVGRRVDKRGLQ